MIEPFVSRGHGRILVVQDRAAYEEIWVVPQCVATATVEMMKEKAGTRVGCFFNCGAKPLQYCKNLETGKVFYANSLEENYKCTLGMHGKSSM